MLNYEHTLNCVKKVVPNSKRVPHTLITGNYSDTLSARAVAQAITMIARGAL